MLSAARIICSILFGSSKKSLNLSPAAPSTFCVSCAATFDARHRSVFRNVADFIHLDAGVSRERGFQLFEREKLGDCAGLSAQSPNLSQQLKTALAGDTSIKVNEIRYVAEDASVAGIKVAAQLTQKVLGAAGDKFKDFFEDPNKMLQMILAAESMRSGGGGLAADGRTGIRTRWRGTRVRPGQWWRIGWRGNWWWRNRRE